MENVLELGDHENHDHRHHADGDADDHAGIDHRTDDFFLELGGFFHEVGQALEDQIEHTAGLTRGDHVHVKFVERLGEFAGRVGERAAAFDFIRHAADDRLEQTRLLLIFENLQAAQDRQTGVLQRGKLAGKSHQLLARDAADGDRHLPLGREALGLLLFLFDGLAGRLFLDLGREKTLTADFGDGFAGIRRLDFVLDLLTGGVHRFIGK